MLSPAHICSTEVCVCVCERDPTCMPRHLASPTSTMPHHASPLLYVAASCLRMPESERWCLPHSERWSSEDKMQQRAAKTRLHEAWCCQVRQDVARRKQGLSHTYTHVCETRRGYMRHGAVRQMVSGRQDAATRICRCVCVCVCVCGKDHLSLWGHVHLSLCGNVGRRPVGQRVGLRCTTATDGLRPTSIPFV